MYNPQALKSQVLFSIEAREQQGYDLTVVKECQATMKEDDNSSWMAVYEAIKDAPFRPDFPYEEPSELDKIHALRPVGPRKMDYSLTDLELKDKIHGALLGRFSGVILGRPVEGWKQPSIEAFLKGANAYPLDYYLPRQSIVDGKVKKVYYERLRCTREYVCFAEPDDDINYVFLALKLFEKLGPNFTTQDVGYNWLDNLEANWTWGPERTAYLNLARYTETWPRYLELDPQTLWKVSHYLNDYNELIGAQIRGDLFGYVTVGSPELAADFAYRDASFTHIKNGIYGEMFIAAMIAAAFCSDNLHEIIEIGLSEIPSNSRLAEAIKNTVKWHDQYKDWLKVYQEIDKNYNHYGGGHTINNAAIVVNGLLSGDGDPGQTICITVMQGQDTDCTTATAGSISGILCGAATFPKKWSEPLNDTVMTSIMGESKNTISGTAERIFNVCRMITKSQRKIKYLYSEPA